MDCAVQSIWRTIPARSPPESVWPSRSPAYGPAREELFALLPGRVWLHLERRELRVCYRFFEVGRGRIGGEADDRTVDVHPGRAIGSRLTGGRIDAGQQVGPGGRQVEHLVLVDLALVQALLDRLFGPQPELRVPQRAVGVGVPRAGERGEVTEDVQQIPAVFQGVDEGPVFGRGVFGR